jgi:Dyp-type peroxidase family
MTSPLQLADIQALVATGHGRRPWAGYLFLTVTARAAAGRALSALAERATTVGAIRNRAGLDGPALQVAVSGPGLLALGLPSAALAEWPAELVEGLHEPKRARLLGDDGESDPRTWSFGGPSGDARADRLHVLVALFAADEAGRDEALSRWTKTLAPGLEVVHVERGTPRPQNREHFGFADGLSQPRVRGLVAGDGPDQVPPGEVVLGYQGAYGELSWSPSVPAAWPGARALSPIDPRALMPESLAPGPLRRPPGPRADLGRNGSYLVFRKLRQHVARFWRYCDAQAEALGRAGDPRAAAWIAAKIVGRDQDGTPVGPVEGGARPGVNGFGYAELDGEGLGCPLGAHVRRMNPRDSRDAMGGGAIADPRFHRLVRRGRSYGPGVRDPRVDDGVDRGLLFVALCADVRRQFEFVQVVWGMNPRFGGLDRSPDLMVGGGGRPGDRITIFAKPAPLHLADAPRVVTMCGGGTFFMPAISALRFLATLAQAGDEGPGLPARS